MTLSGGEAQRIRLATQIGSGLTGVLYVLDEPSIGLHQRDGRLLQTLTKLRDLGNTLIVVSMMKTIRQLTILLILGLGLEFMGEIMRRVTWRRCRADSSLTGAYLSGRR